MQMQLEVRQRVLRRSPLRQHCHVWALQCQRTQAREQFAPAQFLPPLEQRVRSALRWSFNEDEPTAAGIQRAAVAVVAAVAPFEYKPTPHGRRHMHPRLSFASSANFASMAR
jgi:hypothetical protein